MIIILIIAMILFSVAFMFEVRELNYMVKFQRPESDEEGCLYKKLQSDYKGMRTVECRNKFYNKQFRKNGKKCPIRCKGQTYKDCNNNFETMSRTDKYFMTKRVFGMISSILGLILTIVNIVDKLS